MKTWNYWTAWQVEQSARCMCALLKKHLYRNSFYLLIFFMTKAVCLQLFLVIAQRFCLKTTKVVRTQKKVTSPTLNNLVVGEQLSCWSTTRLFKNNTFVHKQNFCWKMKNKSENVVYKQPFLFFYNLFCFLANELYINNQVVSQQQCCCDGLFYEVRLTTFAVLGTKSCKWTVYVIKKK